MLSPWSGNATGVETSEYVVADEAAYTAWVTAAVERYDGDGVDDMPGLLAPIRHWEVDNEPDLKNSLRPKRAPTATTRRSSVCPPSTRGCS